MMAVEHIFECFQRAGPIIFGFVRINGAGIEQLAGGVDHSQLGAGAKPRIETQYGLAGQRRLGEQRTQVGGKDVDGMPIGFLRKLTAHVAFDGRQQQTTGRIFDSQAQLVGEGREDILLEFGGNGCAPVMIFHLHAYF